MYLLVVVKPFVYVFTHIKIGGSSGDADGDNTIIQSRYVSVDVDSFDESIVANT
jgi:hypothetical protein